MREPRRIQHDADVCIVGGGMAGLCASISAARHGARVVLMQDRPVLGGNASSEIRMQISGALGGDNLETGILEELKLENMYRNPNRSYSIWDSVLLGAAMLEPNIALLLNCSCTTVHMDGAAIASVEGWQLTTYTWHRVNARIFVDSSGDSIVACLSGAEMRKGRESNTEYDETIGPEAPDARTMGMSCLIQAREYPTAQSFIPPAWANRYPRCEDLGQRNHDPNELHNNYWWIELGGEQDSIHDTEEIRDELLKVAFGVWDHVKNHGDHRSENWALDWVGFLPGKRESRRCTGDYLLTANDIRAQGRFDDLVAYGGWSMDDHHPAGFKHTGPPTIFHPAPSPYGIPYRCLYSRNVGNLFCAGRNISATHAALSSTRVMGTCALIGQAVGTAAAICIRDGLSPRSVYENRIEELQQTLMEDDCYLPWHTRTAPEMTRQASLSASAGDPEPLRNGVDRSLGQTDNGWKGPLGSWVQYSFRTETRIRQIRMVFDSELSREAKTRENLVSDRFGDQLIGGTGPSYPLALKPLAVPARMVKNFSIQALTREGDWRIAVERRHNYQRLVRVPLNARTRALRFVPTATWGAGDVHVFAWDVT